MSPKQFTAFRVAPEVLQAMRELKARDGVPMSVQVDFAVRAWLGTKGVQIKEPGRKRPASRKRP
jgi:hypothetical protein